MKNHSQKKQAGAREVIVINTTFVYEQNDFWPMQTQTGNPSVAGRKRVCVPWSVLFNQAKDASWLTWPLSRRSVRLSRLIRADSSEQLLLRQQNALINSPGEVVHMALEITGKRTQSQISLHLLEIKKYIKHLACVILIVI